MDLEIYCILFVLPSTYITTGAQQHQKGNMFALVFGAGLGVYASSVGVLL